MGSKAILLAGLILAGCVSTSPVHDPRQFWCDTHSPRRPSVPVINAMTRAELDEMNAYNALGAERCGWAP